MVSVRMTPLKLIVNYNQNKINYQNESKEINKVFVNMAFVVLLCMIKDIQKYFVYLLKKSYYLYFVNI